MDNNTWIFDLEGDGLLDTVTKIWCGVFINVDTEEERNFIPTTISAMVSFMSNCRVLVGHNSIGYDFPALQKCYGYEYQGTKIDTLLMSRLQMPTRLGGHSVEAWGEQLGRAKPHHECWDHYSPEMLHRCKEDCHIQLAIYKALLKEGKGLRWEPAHRLTSRVFEIITKQEQYGWLADQEHMHKSINQLGRWIGKIDDKIIPFLPQVREIQETKKDGTYNHVKKPFLKNGAYTRYTNEWLSNIVSDYSMAQFGYNSTTVGGPYTRLLYRSLNLNSVKEVKDFLLSEGWQPAQWNFNKKTNERTSPKLSKDDPFEGVDGRVGKAVAKRIQCRHRKSQIEGLVKAVRPDGRISQRITGQATTGRFIHNTIVNVPGVESFYGKQMRRIFVSKPGYVLVGTDSAGCQNRMLAARVGDDEFTKTLIQGDKSRGTSIHQINQKAINEITGIFPPYNTCKNINYAFMFGAGDTKLGRMLKGDYKRGKQIRKALLGISPGFATLVTSLTKEWNINGFCVGIDGRPVFIDSEHKVLVYMLQSDEAVLMQYALLFLYKWCTMQGWTHGEEYGFVANNHDEFQAEVREDLAEEYSLLANKSITRAGEYLNIACPHKGESKIGYSWRDTH